MARPEGLRKVAVVLGALVDIVDHQLDGGAGGDQRAIGACDHAGEHANLIWLAPLRRVAGLPRPAFI
jgi:hypothetical protein